jgi:hypothetical protein
MKAEGDMAGKTGLREMRISMRLKVSCGERRLGSRDYSQVMLL